MPLFVIIFLLFQVQLVLALPCQIPQSPPPLSVLAETHGSSSDLKKTVQLIKNANLNKQIISIEGAFESNREVVLANIIFKLIGANEKKTGAKFVRRNYLNSVVGIEDPFIFALTGIGVAYMESASWKGNPSAYSMFRQQAILSSYVDIQFQILISTLNNYSSNPNFDTYTNEIFNIIADFAIELRKIGILKTVLDDAYNKSIHNEKLKIHMKKNKAKFFAAVNTINRLILESYIAEMESHHRKVFAKFFKKELQAAKKSLNKFIKARVPKNQSNDFFHTVNILYRNLYLIENIEHLYCDALSQKKSLVVVVGFSHVDSSSDFVENWGHNTNSKINIHFLPSEHTGPRKRVVKP